MPIETTRDDLNDLTEHVVSDRVTDEEMFACQAAFYTSNPTRLELWDMSAADLNVITIEGLQRFVNRAARLGRARKHGRTAVITRTNLQYGLGRMAEMLGEFEALPFDFRIFRKRANAVAWLQAPSNGPDKNHADNL